jgi:hypothetical protein
MEGCMIQTWGRIDQPLRRGRARSGLKAQPAGGARDNDSVRHASPSPSDQTEIINRADSGHTSQLPAAPPHREPVPGPELGVDIRPVVPCPFHGHWAAWTWARRIALVLAYATFIVWGWGLGVAAWVLHGLAWP